MSIFFQMQNNIEGYLLRTDINSMVQLAINRAIKKYSKNRFWFDETLQTFSTVQGTWSYSQNLSEIPEDIRQIDYLRITVNNVYYKVIQRDIQFIIDANVNNNQGQPTDWAWYDNSIWFYPVPQDDYVITVYYQKEYAPLVYPTDSNDFTNIPEAEELIECEALRWLYEKVILDQDKATVYKAAAVDALRVLNQITESMTGINGNIKATRW
jgi:hypothetical protein